MTNHQISFAVVTLNATINLLDTLPTSEPIRALQLDLIAVLGTVGDEYQC